MKKRTIIIASIVMVCLTTLGFLYNLTQPAAASEVGAEIKSVNVTELRPSDSLVEKMRRADELFDSLQTTVNKVQSNKVVETGDNTTLDETTLALARLLYDASNEAAESTLLAARTQGREGNADDLIYFETFEESHTTKARELAAASLEIEAGVRDGSIIDKGSKETVKAEPIAMQKVAYKGETATFCESSGNTTMQILKPCIAPCLAKKWVECAACIASKVPEGIPIWNNFINCWNGCSGFWKWACRAACFAQFVIKLY